MRAAKFQRQLSQVLRAESTVLSATHQELPIILRPSLQDSKLWQRFVRLTVAVLGTPMSARLLAWLRCCLNKNEGKS